MGNNLNHTEIKGCDPTYSLETCNCTLGIQYDSEMDVDLSIGFDLAIWAVMCPMVILSNLLLLGLAHYERFGGDPQKRSLGNRLASQAALSAIGLNTVRTVTFLLMR